jgi:L-fuculose-phosphate aldolase
MRWMGLGFKVLYKEFDKIGKKLFSRGLNNSHSGNISVRQGDKIFITRTGSMLDELTADDIVEVGLLPDKEIDKKASMELLVHRAIYLTDKNIGAVTHAHAPYAVVLADNCDRIIPYEQEGAFYLKMIPVLKVQNAIASSEVADKIGNYVDYYKSVVVTQHGVFAWGETLEDAYHYLMVTESACKMNYLLKLKNRF